MKLPGRETSNTGSFDHDDEFQKHKQQAVLKAVPMSSITPTFTPSPNWDIPADSEMVVLERLVKDPQNPESQVPKSNTNPIPPTKDIRRGKDRLENQSRASSLWQNRYLGQALASDWGGSLVSPSCSQQRRITNLTP